MEPKTAAHYKIQNWHHSKPGSMGLLQNRLEQIISLPGGVNVQKRLCMICSIQFNLFCRETFRNPCWIPGFFPPAVPLIACHVLACPSTTVKALRPWDFHCLVDKFDHDLVVQLLSSERSTLYKIEILTGTWQGEAPLPLHNPKPRSGTPGFRWGLVQLIRVEPGLHPLQNRNLNWDMAGWSTIAFTQSKTKKWDPRF